MLGLAILIPLTVLGAAVVYEIRREKKMWRRYSRALDRLRLARIETQNAC